MTRSPYGSAWRPTQPGAWLARGRTLRRVGAATVFARRHADLGTVTYLDIGARAGPPTAWRLAARAGHATLVLVEPDADEAERLRRAHPTATVLDVALGASAGERTLHITAEPGRSSMLEPDADALRTISDRDAYDIVRTATVRVVRLDAVLPDRRVDIAKIDVQGMELDVLDGFGRLLDDVVGVEVEVALRRTYAGQPLIGEVNDRLVDAGFGPVDMRPQGTRPDGFLEANAFYVRRDRSGRHDLVARYWRILAGLPSNAALLRRL